MNPAGSHLAPTPCPPGAVEFVLTDEQAAAVAHWTNKPGLAVVIDSIHSGRFDGSAAGKIVARVGAIPTERMGAVLGTTRKNRSRAGENSPTPQHTAFTP